jgi:hypothetical protein
MFREVSKYVTSYLLPRSQQILQFQLEEFYLIIIKKFTLFHLNTSGL